MRFRATIELGGKTATGIVVPDEVVAALNGGKRPGVQVTVGSHTYRSTVGSMGGRFLIPLSAEHRDAAGVGPGDDVEVSVELDTEPRQIAVPDDLAKALAGDPTAQRFFDGLAFTHRKEWVRWITGSKRADTAVDQSRQGHRSPSCRPTQALRVSARPDLDRPAIGLRTRSGCGSERWPREEGASCTRWLASSSPTRKSCGVLPSLESGQECVDLVGRFP